MNGLIESATAAFAAAVDSATELPGTEDDCAAQAAIYPVVRPVHNIWKQFRLGDWAE